MTGWRLALLILAVFVVGLWTGAALYVQGLRWLAREQRQVRERMYEVARRTRRSMPPPTPPEPPT